MSDREDRLRSLLDKVRAKRPEERTTHAAETLDRIRTASGTTAAATAAIDTAPPAPRAAQPTPFPSAFPTQLPSSPVLEPPTSPVIESPTRYSSQPPRVERPLSVEPRAQSIRPSSGAPPAPSAPPASIRPSSGAPAAQSASPSGRPVSIRPQSVAPSGQPVVYSTDQPEFARPKTFGDLLELTLSLRPR